MLDVLLRAHEDFPLVVYECTCANGGVPCYGICEGTTCGAGPVTGTCMSCLHDNLQAGRACTMNTRDGCMAQPSCRVFVACLQACPTN